MVFSITEKSALKRLEPTILNGYEMEFFSFLSNNRSDYKISVKREKLFLDFIAHLTDIEGNSLGMLRAQKLMRANIKKIESSFDKVLKKLHNVFWNIRDGRIYFDDNIKDKEIKDFLGTLKWIHKSDQRIVRWIILYLFYNKKENIIKITDVQKYSKKLIKSDLNKNIKKIVNDKYYSVNVTATSNTIKIKHERNDLKIEQFLINELEWSSKRPAGDLEDLILQELDYSAHSQKGLVTITGASKSQLSPILKKLDNDNLIKFVSDGKQGERFYITNCDNCFKNKDKTKCREDAIESISKLFKQELNLGISKEALNEAFEENQSLLKLELMMYENSRTKDTKIYPKYQMGLRNLFVNTYQEYVQKNKKGDKLINLYDLFAKLGDSFLPGFEIGKNQGAGIFETALKNAGIKFTEEQEEQIKDEIERMLSEAS